MTGRTTTTKLSELSPNVPSMKEPRPSIYTAPGTPPDGHQQRAINQIQEPSLMAQGPSLMALGLLASSPTSTLTLAHRG
jgi:hypothetical protein